MVRRIAEGGGEKVQSREKTGKDQGTEGGKNGNPRGDGRLDFLGMCKARCFTAP